jgi:DNA-binding transcriptional regulator YiaG
VQEILDYQGRLTFTEDQIKELRKSADVKAAEFSNIISRLEAQLRDQQRLRENS